MADQPPPVPAFEHCIDDGGMISHTPFRRLMYQLNDTGSLDHTRFDARSLIEYKGSIMLVILHPGAVPNLHLDWLGRQMYIPYSLMSGDHWLAGMCHLYFPKVDDRYTVHLAVSLLSVAREKGFGRAAVNKLIEHAFDVLRVHRLVAPIVCPIHPNDSDEAKKKATHETKRLCWVFEQYGFKFEGVSRSEVASPRVGRQEATVWQDVYRMSMLEMDYLSTQMSGLFNGGVPQRDSNCPHDPYESMVQRHEREKKDMVVWGCAPVDTSGVDVDDDDDDDDDYGSDDYGRPEDSDD